MASLLEQLPPFPIVAVSGQSAVGRELGSIVDASEAGRDGLTPVSTAPSSPLCGRVSDDALGLDPDLGVPASRIARLALSALGDVGDAARRAVADWGAERVAILVGTSTGGIAESERAMAQLAARGTLPGGYLFDRQHAFHALADLLAQVTGAAGPAYVVSTACSSSAKVFGAAQRLLATGHADAVLVGGADSLCSMTLRGFAGLKVISRSRCRPFDRARDGINIGEGAAFALLTREATSSLALLLGVGESADAHHMTAPHPEGLGAVAAMRNALTIAGVPPDVVGYVHAHGTGTPLNDRAEAQAVREVFGSPRLSSTKGITGHLLGAAGALSVAVAVDALTRGRLPVNVGLQELDPDIEARFVREPTQMPGDHVLCNTFAFGGSNASVLLGRKATTTPAPLPERPVFVVNWAFWAEQRDGGPEPLSPAATLLAPRARGRASLLGRMFAEVVEKVSTGRAVDLRRVPMILGSAYGEMATTLSLLESIASGGAPLSPIKFQASVHNTALGLVSIQLGNRAYSTAIAAGPRTAAMAVLEAVTWLGAHGGSVIVVVSDESAPTPLWQGAPFPALAGALHLSTHPEGARARIDSPKLGVVESHRRAPTRLDGNPSAAILPLLEALDAGRSGDVPLELGTRRGWRVALRMMDGARGSSSQRR